MARHRIHASGDFESTGCGIGMFGGVDQCSGDSAGNVDEGWRLAFFVSD